jgi:tRNA G37 N-methylase TrmD
MTVHGFTKYPHYASARVPRLVRVLLSGDHGKIEEWRREQALIGRLFDAGMIEERS